MLLKQLLGATLIYSLLFGLFLPIGSLFAATFAVQPSGSCMKVTDAGRMGNNQQVIRFYNSCPSRLYINVCVKDDLGDVKLYKSGKYLPTNGFYTIYSFPGVYPRIVQWTSSETSDVEVPSLCTKKDLSSKLYNRQ